MRKNKQTNKLSLNEKLAFLFLELEFYRCYRLRRVLIVKRKYDSRNCETFPFDFFEVDMQEVKRQLFFRFKIRFLVITAGITGKAFKQELINMTRSLGNKNS